MTDLAQFLRARYAERRAIAEVASPWPWKVNPGDAEEVLAADDILVADVFALSGNQTRNTATFIAANDPAAVLADLNVKLALVDLAERTLASAEGDSEVDHYGALSVAEDTLCLLARPFTGHPDHKGEEWAP